MNELTVEERKRERDNTAYSLDRRGERKRFSSHTHISDAASLMRYILLSSEKGESFTLTHTQALVVERWNVLLERQF